MPEFKYQEPFPLEKDGTKYHLLTKDYVSVKKFEGAQFGGKYFAHDIKVVRLPKHGTSSPLRPVSAVVVKEQLLT